MKYAQQIYLAAVRDRSFMQTLGATNPPVYMCRQCLAVSVADKGTACGPCIEIAANRLAAEEFAFRLRRLAIVAIASTVTAAVLLVMVWIAAKF